MKIIAFNGSPRKNWNTVTMLKNVLDGVKAAVAAAPKDAAASSKDAASVASAAEIELIHLYDLNYKGCYSCFACKERGGASYGRCPIKDDLLPLFKRIEEADVVVFGAPIYIGRISGAMQSFLERLLCQYLMYTEPRASLFPKKIEVGFIYTMGVTEEMARNAGYFQQEALVELFVKCVFGSYEMLMSFDTYQFQDYAKVVAPRFDVAKKIKVRDEIFPQDCKKAFALGERLVARAQDRALAQARA
jgi:multimeric flavodoxin WrbA